MRLLFQKWTGVEQQVEEANSADEFCFNPMLEWTEGHCFQNQRFCKTKNLSQNKVTSECLQIRW